MALILTRGKKGLPSERKNSYFSCSCLDVTIKGRNTIHTGLQQTHADVLFHTKRTHTRVALRDPQPTSIYVLNLVNRKPEQRPCFRPSRCTRPADVPCMSRHGTGRIITAYSSPIGLAQSPSPSTFIRFPKATAREACKPFSIPSFIVSRQSTLQHVLQPCLQAKDLQPIILPWMWTAI